MYVCSQTNGCCGLMGGVGGILQEVSLFRFFTRLFVSITHALSCEGLHLRAHYRIFTGIFGHS